MSTPATTDRWLTPAEVAERLRVDRATVYRRIADSDLPAVKLSSRKRSVLRVSERELDMWLTSAGEEV